MKNFLFIYNYLKIIRNGLSKKISQYIFQELKIILMSSSGVE